MAQAANSDTPHPAIAFILALFGDATTLPVFLQTLPNDEGDPDEGRIRSSLLTRELSPILRFIAKHDRSRRGMFICVATLAPGSKTRNKENCRETIGLHADIDFKNVAVPEAEIRALLATLRCQPTVIVRSGGGLHLYWCFKECLPTQANLQRIEDALQLLANLVGGDPAVCEVSRLMRLPGTTNSKYGDQRQVVCEKLDGPRYELDDLEDWLAETQPILKFIPSQPKPKAGPGAEIKAVPDDPWAEIARELGHKSPVEVETLLAAMTIGNIHRTQLKVSAALVHRGQPVEEVFEILLDATRLAAGDAGKKWNWKVEERKLRRLCVTALAKFPPKPHPADVSCESAGADDFSVDDTTVVDIKSRQRLGSAKPKPRQASDKIDHLDIGRIFMEKLETTGEHLMFTETGDYRYEDGLWRLEIEKSLTAWLNSLIEVCIRLTAARSTIKLVSETRSWIVREPSFQKRKVPFDRHGCVPTRSGLVNPRTGEVEAPEAGHFTTWRIEHEYKPTATCPWWLQMLDDVFADRPPESRALHIQLLQEMLGAGLIDAKPKALSRALVLVGGSNYGKSSLIDVMAGLFGSRKIATPLDAVERGDHGTMPFAYRLPWVLHEAFDAGKWHLPSKVKSIISCNEIEINMKGGKIFEHTVTAPIFWGSNVPPQFKEATKAITNRIVVVECKREFDVDKPVGADREARNRNFERPQDLILATEMEGVLAWAVEGLKRALARGCFILPEESKEAAENVRLDSNIVAGFIEDCVNFNSNGMVSTADFNAAVASWWLENKGEDRSTPSGESIGRALRALGEMRIATDRKELRGNSRRYYAGLGLNAEGRRHWSNTVTSDAFAFQGKKASTSSPDENPNRPIPAAWDDKNSIRAMRVAHEKSVTAPQVDGEENGHEKSAVTPKGDRRDQSESDGSPERSLEKPPGLSREPRF